LSVKWENKAKLLDFDISTCTLKFDLSKSTHQYNLNWKLKVFVYVLCKVRQNNFFRCRWPLAVRVSVIPSCSSKGINVKRHPKPVGIKNFASVYHLLAWFSNQYYGVLSMLKKLREHPTRKNLNIVILHFILHSS